MGLVDGPLITENSITICAPKDKYFAIGKLRKLGKRHKQQPLSRIC